MKCNRTFKTLKKGFTLIELMIVIAIIAILATIAIPSYQNYTKKAAMSELLQVAGPYRSEVELCAYNLGKIQGCSAGSQSIQGVDNIKGKYVNSITVQNGVITVSGKDALDGFSYILTPEINTNGVTWKTTCTPTTSDVFPAGFCTN